MKLEWKGDVMNLSNLIADLAEACCLIVFLAAVAGLGLGISI